jgi:hypothetical protein
MPLVTEAKSVAAFAADAAVTPPIEFQRFSLPPIAGAMIARRRLLTLPAIDTPLSPGCRRYAASRRFRHCHFIAYDEAIASITHAADFRCRF